MSLHSPHSHPKLHHSAAMAAAGIVRNQRRSKRMGLNASIGLSGEDRLKCSFTMPARATNLNKHGAAVQLTRDLEVGSVVRLQNKNRGEASARIVALLKASTRSSSKPANGRARRASTRDPGPWRFRVTRAEPGETENFVFTLTPKDSVSHLPPRRSSDARVCENPSGIFDVREQPWPSWWSEERDTSAVMPAWRALKRRSATKPSSMTIWAPATPSSPRASS